MSDDKEWPVMEIFGPTIQGEGAMAGQVSHFLRLGGCGYRCTWCDSMHAVDPAQVKARRTMLNTDDIVALLVGGVVTSEADVSHLVPQRSIREYGWLTISGGDPVMHDLLPLILELKRYGIKVAVETQGQFYKPWLGLCDLVTMSPKPPSAGMMDKYDPRMLEVYETFLGPKLNVKIPVLTYDDFQWAAALFASRKGPGNYLSIVTDPSPEQDLASVRHNILSKYSAVVGWMLWPNAAPDLSHVTVLPQLHALIWGTKQGV